MKIKCLLILLLIAFNAKYVGQVNLVMNPSFENYTLCPIGGGEVINAFGWNSFRDTPDLFSSCAPVLTNVGVPKNLFGFQLPFNGNNYGGFMSYLPNPPFYREIIGVNLNSSLLTGQKYFFSFRINKADSYNNVGYSTNNIGVRFSTIKSSNLPIDNFAHYYTSNVITDTLNWIKLSGSFVADSAYNYMMFGNFFDDLNTIIINDGSGVCAYYYIDEVCLSTDSITCQENITKLYENRNYDDNFNLYPNPASNGFYVSYQNGESLSITNSIGDLQFKSKIDNSDILFINTTDWSNGIYFVRINNDFIKVVISH